MRMRVRASRGNLRDRGLGDECEHGVHRLVREGRRRRHRQLPLLRQVGRMGEGEGEAEGYGSGWCVVRACVRACVRVV